jgi:predicted RNase H-like HicB family nuclease
MSVKNQVSQLKLTIIFVEDETMGGYTAFFKHYPEVISEGETKKEALKNLWDALMTVQEVENVLNL